MTWPQIFIKIFLHLQADIDPYTDPYQNLKDDHYTDYTNFDEPINDKIRDEIQMQFSVTNNPIFIRIIDFTSFTFSLVGYMDRRKFLKSWIIRRLSRWSEN